MALGTIRSILPLETSLLFWTEAVPMCPRLQGRIRIREVLLGMVIGPGVAGLLVVRTNEGVYMKRKPVVRYNTGKISFL